MRSTSAPELEGLGIACGVLQARRGWGRADLEPRLPRQPRSAPDEHPHQRRPARRTAGPARRCPGHRRRPRPAERPRWGDLAAAGRGGAGGSVRVGGGGGLLVRPVSVAGRVVGLPMAWTTLGQRPGAAARGGRVDTITPLVGGADGRWRSPRRSPGSSGPLVSEDGLTVDGVSLRASIETDPDADPPAAPSVVVQGLAFSASDPPEDLDLRGPRYQVRRRSGPAAPRRAAVARRRCPGTRPTCSRCWGSARPVPSRACRWPT